MEEPKTILEAGTRIRTDKVLGSPAGIFVKEKYLQERKPDTVGIIRGWVAGHGGDIYWVQHEGCEGTDGIAAYGWMEFELEPTPAPTVWEHLSKDE